MDEYKITGERFGRLLVTLATGNTATAKCQQCGLVAFVPVNSLRDGKVLDCPQCVRAEESHQKTEGPSRRATAADPNTSAVLARMRAAKLARWDRQETERKAAEQAQQAQQARIQNPLNYTNDMWKSPQEMEMERRNTVAYIIAQRRRRQKPFNPFAGED